MNENTRDLAYQQYRSETDPVYRMKFLDILVGMLQEERAELEKYQNGISVPNTKKGAGR